MTRTLVVGLGNPLLGDDGAGWRIADECARREPDLEVCRCAVGGLRLIERLAGYDRAILVDVMTTGTSPPGTVYCLPLEELPDPGAGHTGSSHDMTLQTALELGQALGMHLPDRLVLVAVEAERVDQFSERLSPAVADAIPAAVETVMRQVHPASSGSPRSNNGFP